MGPVQKKMWGPMGACRNFCKGRQLEGLGDGSPMQGLEADGMLFKMTYTDIVFCTVHWHHLQHERFFAPHVGAPFIWGPCWAKHAEHS